MNSETLSGFLPWLLAPSLRASLAAAVIIALQSVLGRHLPARWSFALWTPFVLILLFPVLRDSPLSLERLWQAGTPNAAIISAENANVAPAAATFAQSSAAGPAAGTSPLSSLTWGTAGGVWLAGFLGILTAGTLAHRRQMRRIRKSTVPVSPQLREEISRAARTSGLRRTPEILCSTAVEGPAVTGPLRPVLLLPAAFPGDLTPRQTALILRHEAVHLRRRDSAWDLLFWILNAAHWFNPVIRFAFSRLRADRESARDAEVLATAATEERAAYGEALLRLQLPPGSPFLRAGFVGLVNAGGRLRHRLAGLGRHRRVPFAWHLAGLTLAVLIHLTAGAAAAPQEAPPAKPESPAAPAPARAGDAAVAKAKKLIIPRVQIKNATIDEAAQYFRAKSIELDESEADPARKGIDIILIMPEGNPKFSVTLDLRDASIYDLLASAAEMSGLQLGSAAESNALVIAPPGSKSLGAESTPQETGQPSSVSKAAELIILDRIQFVDVHINEAAHYLRRKSQQDDPEKRGIQIELAPGMEKKIPITLDLRNVTVLDAVQTIARLTGCKVEDDGTKLIIAPAE